MLLLFSSSSLPSPFVLKDLSLVLESCLAKCSGLLESGLRSSRGEVGEAFRSEKGVEGLELVLKEFFSEHTEDGLELLTEAVLLSECEDDGLELVTEAFLSE